MLLLPPPEGKGTISLSFQSFGHPSLPLERPSPPAACDSRSQLQRGPPSESEAPRVNRSCQRAKVSKVQLTPHPMPRCRRPLPPLCYSVTSSQNNATLYSQWFKESLCRNSSFFLCYSKSSSHPHPGIKTQILWGLGEGTGRNWLNLK